VTATPSAELIGGKEGEKNGNAGSAVCVWACIVRNGRATALPVALPQHCRTLKIRFRRAEVDMKKVFLVWGCIYFFLAGAVALDLLETGKLLSVLLFTMASIYNFMFLNDYLRKGD
jgi:hypothetical protein